MQKFIHMQGSRNAGRDDSLKGLVGGVFRNFMNFGNFEYFFGTGPSNGE